MTAAHHTSVSPAARPSALPSPARLLAVPHDMEIDEVDDLLDRLEQVRVEDCDADNRYSACEPI